jgi:hypothetical protein
MGKKYKVICSAVNGKQKIYSFDDFVDESDFIEGHAEGYVKSGHMEHASKKDSVKLEKVTDTLSEKDKKDGEEKAKLKADKADKEADEEKEIADAIEAEEKAKEKKAVKK